jgi:hypothetical protein
MDEFLRWYLPYVFAPTLLPLVAQSTAWLGRIATGTNADSIHPVAAYKDGQLIWVCVTMGGAAIADTQHKADHAALLVIIAALSALALVLFGTTAGVTVKYPPEGDKKANLLLLWLTVGMTGVMSMLAAFLHAQRA